MAGSCDAATFALECKREGLPPSGRYSPSRAWSEPLKVSSIAQRGALPHHPKRRIVSTPGQAARRGDVDLGAEV